MHAYVRSVLDEATNYKVIASAVHCYSQGLVNLQLPSTITYAQTHTHITCILRTIKYLSRL